MKLGELRKELRNDPTGRNCHICAWTATPRRATLVMSGANGQWYDCGQHPDEPNGKPLFCEDIGEWFLKHGLVEGKKAPEVPEVVPDHKKCKDCSGSGEDINSINGECAACGGNGWVPSNIEKLKSTVDALKKLAEDIDPLPRSGSSGSPMSKVWADKLVEHGGLADEPLKVSLHSAGGEEVWYNGYERAAFPAKMLTVWSEAGEMLFGVEMLEETAIEVGETPTFEAGAIKVSIA